MGEIGEIAEEVRDQTRNVGPVNPKELEVVKLCHAWLDGTSQIGELVEHECFQEHKVADLRWDLAREFAGDDRKRDNTVGSPIALDAVPLAAVSFQVP